MLFIILTPPKLLASVDAVVVPAIRRGETEFLQEILIRPELQEKPSRMVCENRQVS
jgi:hypothetical protein